MIENKKYKSGFVALFGRPNSGKSSLMNTVLQEQISIVTPLPQTTRKNIRGIYTTDDTQIIFVDTPGLHSGKHTYNDMMRDAAVGAVASGIDIVCYLIDLSRSFGTEEKECAEIVSSLDVPVLLVFNKVDKCEDVDIKIKEFLSTYSEFEKLPRIKISATSSKSKKIFLDAIEPMLCEGPKYFDGESLTDETMRSIAAEYIRKQIILNTREEVPHATFVEIEQYKETGEKHEIVAAIHVETIGQKGIVIGARGAMIEKIKAAARKDIESLIDMKASLKLHVRVTPNWRDDHNFLDKNF